jgi:hypothetical protein
MAGPAPAAEAPDGLPVVSAQRVSLVAMPDNAPAQ